MNITRRPYKPLADFERVRQFLLRHHQPFNADGNFYPCEWEYMHTHSLLPYDKLSRFGLWECDGELVGVAHFEWFLGEAMFELNPRYSFLKEEMLDYAQSSFPGVDDAGRPFLTVSRLHDHDEEMIAILQARGYTKTGDWDWAGFFDLAEPPPPCPLPDGFSIVSLAQENNLAKIQRLMWRGFDHEGEPDGDLDSQRVMQTGPTFNPDLNLVVKAPNGDYAVYCGMWYDAALRESYLEPLCTDPDYRKMGLAKAALYEAMRRTQAMGSLRCVAGGQPFYQKVGFVQRHRKQDWTKYLDH